MVDGRSEAGTELILNGIEFGVVPEGVPKISRKGSHQQLCGSWAERQPEDAVGLVSPTGLHLVQQDEQVSASQSPAPEGGVKQGGW